ncbi:MAG: hypothetical protein ACK4P4_05610 [Allorhizobium sp.]
MKHDPEMLLPHTLQSAACHSGAEWGWRPETIPLVIDAAEKLGLLNIGGQLQFLLPQGTCECYWVEVAALTGEPNGLTWAERVARAARVARQQMVDISFRYDFIEEGRKAFTDPFAAYEAAGGNLQDCIWFIWYLEAERR